MSKADKALNICLCYFPFASDSSRVHTYTCVEILEPIAYKLCVISGGLPKNARVGTNVDTVTLRVKMNPRASMRIKWLAPFKWAIKYVLVQGEISYHLVRKRHDYDIALFHESPHYAVPIVVARLLRKKVVKFSPATISAMHSYKRLSVDYWASFFFRCSEAIGHRLAHRIIIPTQDKENRLGFRKYRHKTAVAMYAYIDSEIFRQKKEWEQRDNIIGFIGRLNDIRGALKLAQAIPLILEKKPAVRFLIVGSGELLDDMKAHLEQAHCLDKVQFVGWVPNDTIPDYLNAMKFHVSPGKWDSPGTINLEAMACGTVAVANAVGGVPDIVFDGETGFLLKDNNPSTIANTIVAVWDDPRISDIRRKASLFVQQNYSRESVVNAWRDILTGL